jgi:hypothetical protein
MTVIDFVGYFFGAVICILFVLWTVATSKGDE